MFTIDPQMHRSSGYATVTTAPAPISKVDNTSTAATTTFTATRATDATAWTITNVVANDIAVTSDGYWGCITTTGANIINVNEWVNKNTDLPGTPADGSSVTVHRLGLVKSLSIKAMSTNTQNLYIGRHGTATTTDLALEAGNAVTLGSDSSALLDVTKVYVRSASGTQYATFIQGVSGEGVSQSGGITVTDATMTNLGWVSVTDSGAIGDGTTDDTTAINTAAGLAAGKVLYFPPGTYRIADNVTVDAGICCEIAKGAIIKPDYGKQIIISGPFEAGAYQIFDDYSGVYNTATSTDDGLFGGAGGWTAGTGWAIGSGVATHTAGNTGTLSYTNCVGRNGFNFIVKYTIGGTVNGGIIPSIGGVAGFRRNSTGTYVDIITGTGTGALTFTPETNFGGTIDNVSVYMLGTHSLAGYVSEIFLEWWGGKADASTDNWLPFEKALETAKTGGQIKLLDGTYNINTTVQNFERDYLGVHTSGGKIEGSGVGNTVIEYQGTTGFGIDINQNVTGTKSATFLAKAPCENKISDLTIKSPNAASDTAGCLKLSGASITELNHLGFYGNTTGPAGTGVYLSEATKLITDTGHVNDTNQVFDATNTSYAIRFTGAAVSGKVKTVKIRLGKTGGPIGTITASIYTNTGIVPNAITGDASTGIDITTLSTSGSEVTFTFGYTSTMPELTASTVYWIVLSTSGYVYAGGAYIWIDTLAGGHANEFAYYAAAAWTASNYGADLELDLRANFSIHPTMYSCYVGKTDNLKNSIYSEQQCQLILYSCELNAYNGIIAKGVSNWIRMYAGQLSNHASGKNLDIEGSTLCMFNGVFIEGSGNNSTLATGKYVFIGCTNVNMTYNPSNTTFETYGNIYTYRLTGDGCALSDKNTYIYPANHSALYSTLLTTETDTDAINGYAAQAATVISGQYLYFRMASTYTTGEELSRGLYLYTVYAKSVGTPIERALVLNAGFYDAGAKVVVSNTYTLSTVYKPYSIVFPMLEEYPGYAYFYWYNRAVTSTIRVSHIEIRRLGTEMTTDYSLPFDVPTTCWNLGRDEITANSYKFAYEIYNNLTAPKLMLNWLEASAFGIADGIGASASILYDSRQNFMKTVRVGATVYNRKDSTSATVVSVDSDVQLTLSGDIMDDGERYLIYPYKETDLSGNSNTGTYYGSVGFPVKVGNIWALSLDGTDDYVSIDDTDTLSFGDSSADSVFSIGAWVYVNPYSNYQTILSKYSAQVAEAREWKFAITTDEKLNLMLYDESADAYIMKTTDVALSTGWHFVCCTYDASEAHTGIILYVDGEVVASTGALSGVYVAMENLGQPVLVSGYKHTTGGIIHYWQTNMGPLFVEGAVLSAATIRKLNLLGRAYLGI